MISTVKQYEKKWTDDERGKIELRSVRYDQCITGYRFDLDEVPMTRFCG